MLAIINLIIPVIMLRLAGALTGLAVVSAVLGGAVDKHPSLADHFSKQVQRGLHTHAATHLPASAAGPILKFDPTLFIAPASEDTSEDIAMGGAHNRKAYEALLAHEVAARRAFPETTFPYALCGPQESSEAARAAIADAALAKAQPPKVVFASRVIGAACWQANLRAADAERLAAAPAFFHVSPIPAAAKIAPGVVLAKANSGALKPSAHAFSSGSSNGGLRVHLHPQAVAAEPDGSRAELARRWADHGFGLHASDGASAGARKALPAAASLLPAARAAAEVKTHSSWAAALEAAEGGNCAERVSATLRNTDAGATGPMRIAFKVLSPSFSSSASSSSSAADQACVLAALAFLAAQPEVSALEIAPPMKLLAAVPGTGPAGRLEAPRTPAQQGGGAKDLARIKAAFEAAHPARPTRKVRAASEAPADGRRAHRSLNYVAKTALETDQFRDVALINGTGQLVQVTDTGFDDASCFLRDTGAEDFLVGGFNGDYMVSQEAVPVARGKRAPLGRGEKGGGGDVYALFTG